jgi:hypothetical protein
MFPLAELPLYLTWCRDEEDQRTRGPEDQSCATELHGTMYNEEITRWYLGLNYECHHPTVIYESGHRISDFHSSLSGQFPASLQLCSSTATHQGINCPNLYPSSSIETYPGTEC